MKSCHKLLLGMFIAVISTSVSSRENVQDRYIVILKSSSPAEVAKAHGLKPERVYKNVLSGFSARVPATALKGLQNNPHVEKLEKDSVVSLSLPAAQGVQVGATWGLDRIDQKALPLDGNYNYNVNAANVTAYVVDSGINPDHVEFSGRAKIAWDAFGGDGRDCNGHGTHVAGTIGSDKYGVAKGVNLVSLRALDCTGYGSWSGIISALDWIGGNASGPSVVNMSIGGGLSSSVNDAVTRLTQKNITVVVSAGNSNTDACNQSPAATPSAITVASSGSSDYRSSFSNWGNCVDIFAPGEGIRSTYYSSNTATASMSGTSMASPHVAGVVALYLAQYPTLAPSQVATVLKGSATQGVIMNAQSANSGLAFAFPDPTVDPGAAPAPAPVLVAPTAPGSLSVSQSRSGINIFWGDASDNEDGFELQRSTDGISFSSIARLAANSTSFNDKNFIGGYTYFYRVRAFNAAGNSTFSNVGSVVAKSVTKTGRK